MTGVLRGRGRAAGGGDPAGATTRRGVGALLAAGLVLTPAVSLVLAPAGLAAAAPAQVGAAAPTATAAPAATPPKRTPRPWRSYEYPAQRVTWSTKACSSSIRNLGSAAADVAPGSRVLCATIRTPLDWNDLTKGSGTLRLTRVVAPRPKGAPARRVLFVNPGGPGVAADWLAPSLAAMKPALARTHDIVAVDPRGTGGSMPVNCRVDDGGITGGAAPSSARISGAQKAVRATVDACVRKEGAVLRHITTRNTVRDHDLARRVLRANTVDFYGVSAGTWLGARYAETYPRQVGRFVLDSNTEFTTTWRASFAHQPQGFQRRFDAQFLPWAARHHADYGLGRRTAQARSTYVALREKVAAGKVRGMSVRALDAKVVQSLYTDEGFLDLADCLVSLRRGHACASDGASGAAAAGSEDTVFMAIQCNDSPWSRNPASYVVEGLRLGRLYPIIGYSWVTSPCAYWPYAPQPAPAPVGARPPMLMVQTEMDAATPLAGARRAHAATPNTRMVTVDDEGNHGAYLGDNACVDRHLTTYLTRGTTPRTDAVCPGVPLPDDRRAYPVGERLTPAASAPRRAPAGASQERLRDYARDRVTEAAGPAARAGAR